MTSKTIPYSHQDLRSQLSDIPQEEWCDFRVDYENGITLKTIGEKYHCDPRTVRRCLLLNQDSRNLGKQNAPTKIKPFLNRIRQAFYEFFRWQAAGSYTKDAEDVQGEDGMSSISLNGLENMPGICQASRYVTGIIREEGYAGSERTVRNYLRTQYYGLRKEE